MNVKNVDAYVAGLSGWQAAVVNSLRKIVREAAPTATEAYKWAQPVFELNGPFAYIKAFKTSVNFGFWRGAEMDDPKGLLEGDGNRMRHMKLTKPADIKAPALKGFIRQAIKLNQAKGDPTKPTNR